jgi:urease accessory protein
MLIRERIGNLDETPASGHIDWLQLEWFETTRKIQRKKTLGGREVALKLTREGQQLKHHDILYRDDAVTIAVEILSCDTMVIRPATMAEMAQVCYEIGNKHLPLFLEGEELLIPADEPLFRWLQAAGYNVTREKRHLKNMLRTNVQPHGHGNNGPSFFEKILDLASR